jgi:hypothetical protein
MPALKNQKREQFCQMMFQGARFGWSQGTCYMKAGFRSTGHSAETGASRMMKKSDIQRRLAELGGKGARSARVTAQSLIEKLDIVFDGSVAEKQYSAAGRAVETQGKLAGVMVDRTEIGPPGAFDGIETIDDVARAILSETSLDDALAVQDAVREALLRLAGDRAQDVTPEPAQPEPAGYETARALELLRPESRRSR